MIRDKRIMHERWVRTRRVIRLKKRFQTYRYTRDVYENPRKSNCRWSCAPFIGRVVVVGGCGIMSSYKSVLTKND